MGTPSKPQSLGTPSKPQSLSTPHDVSEYLYFSSNTKGLSGSPVKIKADLFVDFFCNVDTETHDGQCIIRDIESLKIFGKTLGQGAQVSVPAKNESASHRNRLQKVTQTLGVLSFNQSTSPEKTFTTKNVKVFFRILQNTGDAYPTVYISDIRVMKRGRDNTGGLYEYASTQFGLGLAKSKSKDLDGKVVYISAASDSAQSAMDNAVAATNKSRPTLFFSPAQISAEIGLFKRPRLTSATRDLINALSELLQQNQRRSVEWYVEGEGAAVLSEALTKVPGTFEKHSFKFINARFNLAKLIADLEQRKAQLKGEFLDYTRDQTALLAIAQHATEITDRLKRLPVQNGYDRITRRYLVDYFVALGQNGNATALLEKAKSVKGANTTFIDAITLSRKGFR